MTKNTLPLNCFLICLIYLFLTASNLWAQGLFNSPRPIIQSPHSFTLSFEPFYFDYKENSVNMEEDGWMYGGEGAYRFHGLNNLMLGVDFEFAYSDGVDYKGATWSGIKAKSDTNNWIIQTRGLIGYDLYFENQTRLSVYTGIGYRHWHNDIKDTGGYVRNISYIYSPIGATLKNVLSQLWSWSINAEYDIFWHGRVKSNLSDIDPFLSDSTIHQGVGDGYGIRCFLKVERKLAPGLALSLGPYFRYWHVSKSDLDLIYYKGEPLLYVYEPKNKTYTYGIRIGLKF